MIVAISPKKGIPEPISRPKTKEAPVKPSKTPIHCWIVIFSSRMGHLRCLSKLVEE